ncbi:prephenate dehydratase [Nakamurella antarctica]|uniref:prephenate dehydratase n=1 Tax=Nakamurella antarctica TaxID=1902245 RepID=UPI001EF120FE|nr:prephenate dehydratase [Nakamurella antarctica]
MTQRWAYLGPEGTFTQQAVLTLREQLSAAEQSVAGQRLLQEDISTGGLLPPTELLPAAGIAKAIAAVRSGTVDAACVPLENSVEGSVPLTLDELTHGDPLVIVAETYVQITFDLLVRPGTAIADIRSVGSHPHGHAQVRGFVTATLPDAESVVYSSTAAAAEAVLAGGLDAAAAAPLAGRKYGLESVATDIGEVRGAVTRFVLLRRPSPPPPATGNDRTSLVVFVDNQPGTLLAVLAELANRGINLTRLESRPSRVKMGEYYFLLDADGHVSEPAMAEAISALHRRSAGLRYLGSYQRAVGAAGPVPPYASTEAFAAATAFVASITAGETS